MKDIVLKNISKSFGMKTVLNEINFTFEAGKFYVLRGESGCGKTTLLNIIAGYYMPDSGEIISEANIEYLFQDELLFTNLTVKENMLIKLYSRPNASEPDDSLLINILEKLNIPDLLNCKIAFLSGGERQRIELANILLSNPDVVLLDEPTAKLDAENKKNSLDLITSAFSGKTLIASSHESELFPDTYIPLHLERGKLLYEK